MSLKSMLVFPEVKENVVALTLIIWDACDAAVFD